MKNTPLYRSPKLSMHKIIIIEHEWVYADCLRTLYNSYNTCAFHYYNTESFINTGLHLLSDADLVLMDIRFGNENGLDLIPIIKSHNLSVPIIVISYLQEYQRIKKNFISGDQKYPVNRDSLMDIYDQIVTCIQKRRVANAQKIYVSLIEKSVQANKGSKFDQILTKREQNVITYLEKGLTQKEIGYSMNISAATVNQHLKHIYQKMNVRSKTELLYKMLN